MVFVTGLLSPQAVREREAVVHDGVLQSGLDTLLIAVPLVGVLLIVLFRLDTMVAAPKQAAGPRHPPSGTDKHGRMLFSDPDGRPWPSARDSK